MMDRMTGVVLDRGDYLVIRTPSRPNYYWGNYLLMKEPPRAGDVERWIGLFEKEIGPKEETGFIALTWDSIKGDHDAIEPFADFGFAIQKSTVLTAKAVHKSPKHHSDLLVRQVESDQDWDDYVENHFDPDWPYADANRQRQFLRESADQFRAFADSGRALRYGVELDGRLIADAGLFWSKNLGRFNSIATHRDYRRRGACSTLVYELSKFALNTLDLETLVMEADEDYHAAAIYESIGFEPTEKLVKLEWRPAIVPS